MDIVLPKKNWTNKKFAITVGSAVIILLAGAAYYFSTGKSRADIDAERITISTVSKGAFKEYIQVSGVVSPVSTIYLDAIEGGRVEQKYVEDGVMMKKGEPILKLSNTDLELSLVNQETAVFNLLTQIQISGNAARQNTITKLNQMADAENAWKEAERVYKMNKQLLEVKAIALQEFKQSQIVYDYQLKRKKLTEQILKQDSSSTRLELEQTKKSYERTQNALAVMHKKVDDLTVRAPIDGQLTSMDVEIGQNKNKGERLGQIDVLSGFKVRADIDEHYISRIFNGLQGDFTFNNKTYQLKITKVFTQVTDARFQVDMMFIGKAPDDIRRGQTLPIRLVLSDETQAVILPRGGFFQQTGGNWIFKLSTLDHTAYKVDIELGRQNPKYYEVLQGLKPGDKVITSGYENYDNINELMLKGIKDH
jgi:HlyD family secretion protein